MFYQDILAMHGTKLICWKIEPARRLSESRGVVYHTRWRQQKVVRCGGIFRYLEVKRQDLMDSCSWWQKERNQFIPGFVGGASGRQQLPLSSMGKWLARISGFFAAYLTSVQRLHGGRWSRAQQRRVGDENVSHPFINGVQNHWVL